ncbi:uncharacterized protein DEA37_0005615 [Paragonimus westermani]|uniref:Endonuclease/exonuclease/phosphatase domain-containing protein n=1 Tax=Paragonimus westermani TaxID=34504 RepID=A0A5J4P046_9TREM|nr:uncharacterized protein DEA37_0005615 [Paragonimus westermani]
MSSVQDKNLVRLLVKTQNSSSGLSNNPPLNTCVSLDTSLASSLVNKLSITTPVATGSVLPLPTTIPNAPPQSHVSIDKQLPALLTPLHAQAPRVPSCTQMHPRDAAAPFRNRNLDKSKGPQEARGRKTLTIGTWNVRTLLDRCSTTERPERRTARIAMELRQYGIDVAALSQTRLADQSKLREAGAGYTFYWIGYAADSVLEHGVCFAVVDRINALMIYETHNISLRMLSMLLRLGQGKCATFISVCRPTKCHSDDTKDQLYDQLSATIRSAPNGDRLLHLYATHELAITNTRFQLAASDITTWTHPRSGHDHLLDYVIVGQRDIREVRITRVMRGAECSTDHRLVRTKLLIHVRKSVYCRSSGQRQKLDIRRLENSETKAAFQRAVVARLHNAPVPITPKGM